MLADGDKVVTSKTFHGTHTGEFMGLPPTGNAISVDGIDICRVHDGKFVENWNVLDTLALVRADGRRRAACGTRATRRSGMLLHQPAQ
jgi:predicted ester cyclase